MKSRVHVIVKTIPGKGRGVFADKDYAKDFRVLIHEILPVPPADCAAIDKTFLNAYLFFMDDIYFLALGEGSLLNHSANPNLDYRFDAKAGRIEFHALRPINPGEELTIDYDWGEYPWDNKKHL